MSGKIRRNYGGNSRVLAGFLMALSRLGKCRGSARPTTAPQPRRNSHSSHCLQRRTKRRGRRGRCLARSKWWCNIIRNSRYIPAPRAPVIITGWHAGSSAQMVSRTSCFLATSLVS